MAYDSKRYVHLHAENYNQYGITFKTKNSKETIGDAHEAFKKNILNTKVKNVNEKTLAIENRLNNMLSGNPQTADEQRVYEEAQQYLKNNNAKVSRYGRVTSSDLTEDEETHLKKLREHMNKLDGYTAEKNKNKSIQYNTLIRYLEECREILKTDVFHKKDLTTSDIRGLNKRLDTIEKNLLKTNNVIEEIIKSTNEEGEEVQTKKLVALRGKKGISTRTKNGKDVNFLKTLLAVKQVMSNYTPVLTNTQGAYLEAILSDFGHIQSQHLLIEEMGKIAVKKKGSSEGTKTSEVNVTGNALKFIAGLYDVSTSNKKSNSFVNLGLKEVSFQQTSKTDAVLSIKELKGKTVNINAKNLNLYGAQSTGISLVDETALMTILSQDFKEDFIYHLLNVYAEHIDNVKIDQIYKNQCKDTLTLAILYRAFTGVSGKLSDFFVVNNNSYTGYGKQFYVLSIPDVMNNFMKLYENKQIDNRNKVYNIMVNGVSDNEFNSLVFTNQFEKQTKQDKYWFIAYQRRFAKLFYDMHRYKISVSITPKIIDDYFNQNNINLK